MSHQQLQQVTYSVPSRASPAACSTSPALRPLCFPTRRWLSATSRVSACSKGGMAADIEHAAETELAPLEIPRRGTCIVANTCIFAVNC